MAGKVKLAVGLDLGSAQTRCVVCTVEDFRIRFLGFGVAPALGWQKGRVTDQESLAESIRHAVQDAEKTAGVSIESVVLGMGGASVEGVNSRGLYEFGRPREIQPDDLRYAVELAAKLRLQEDRLLLQVSPQDFTIDGRAGYRNPRNTTCSRLEANVHLVTASAHDHQSLVGAVHLAHLSVEESVFEPIAGAYACVLQQERARGVAVIDVGHAATNLVVYDGDALLLASTIPVHADYFTRDVAFGLTVSYEDAEHIKCEYGCAILGLTSDNSLIEIPSPEGRAPRETTRRQLNDILEARAEQLFELVQADLAKVGMEQALLEGVVLTGGGALLNGMCDMAERVLNCQARNGLPLGIQDWPEELHNPAWTTAAGLSMYSGRLRLRQDATRRNGGIRRYIGGNGR